jgi:hypothetical protein
VPSKPVGYNAGWILEPFRIFWWKEKNSIASIRVKTHLFDLEYVTCPIWSVWTPHHIIITHNFVNFVRI